jgi:hypothetical protein
MKINEFKIKFLGKTEIMFRVLDARGEVVQVLETRAAAESWIAAQ